MENQEIKLTVTLSEVKGNVVITFPFDLRNQPDGPIKSAAAFVGNGIRTAIENIGATVKSIKSINPELNHGDCETAECTIRFTRVGESFMLDMTNVIGMEGITDEKFKAFCTTVRDAVAKKLDEIYKHSDGKIKKIIKQEIGFGGTTPTNEQLTDALWSQRN